MKKISLLLVIASFISLVSCSTFSGPTTYAYEDFEMIWSPRSGFIRVPNENVFLVLMKGPKDPYSRLYKLNPKTKELSLEFDAGAPISNFHSDPKHQHFYIAKDSGGDENYQIYEYFPQEKKIQKIFGHSGFTAYAVDTSEDGQRIYLSSNHENKAVYSLYVYDRKSLKVTKLSSGISITDALISPKEDQAVLSKSLKNSEDELYLLNFATRKIQKLKIPSKNSYDASAFVPKRNDLVLVNTNHNYDRQYCATLNLKTLKLSVLHQDKNKDLYCIYSITENVSTIVENFDARDTVKSYEGFFEKEIKLPVFLKNKSLNAQSLYPYEGRKWSFVARSSDDPGTLYEYSLQSGEIDELFKLNASPIKEKDFAGSFDFNYRSFDGLPLHAVYFAKKEWTKGNKKYPVILWPHGGPDYLTEHDYSVRFQYWVNRGYIVLGPNFRGSTGYGKKFETLNDKDWGGAHIKDLISAKKEFSKLPFVDADNFFIVGGSFGGFSVLSAITQFPTEFKAAEASVAIGNLFTFVKSIPPDPAWQGEFYSEVGHPVKDKKLYQERSPFFHAQNIKIPLKINQAENDVRTVLGEMNAFVARLNELKIPVEYTIYKNEGHSFQNKENIRNAIVGTVDFLDKHRK